MKTKRSESKAAVMDFTSQVKTQLNSFYAFLFNDNWKRVDDKTRYQRNDAVAVEILPNKIGIMEKFIHSKYDNQELYYEIQHTNARGSIVPAAGFKTDATIALYAICEGNRLVEVYGIKTAYLKQRAREAWKGYLLHRSSAIDIKATQGEELRNGQKYEVFSYAFNPVTLPDEAFIINKDGITMRSKFQELKEKVE